MLPVYTLFKNNYNERRVNIFSPEVKGMNSSNPMLKEKIFSHDGQETGASEKMTFGGVADKALILCGLLVAAGGWTWKVYSSQGVQSLSYYLIAGIILCLSLSIWTFHHPAHARRVGPVIAISVGFILGCLSAVFEVEFSGVLIQTVAATVAVLIISLLIYKFHLSEISLGLKPVAILSLAGILLANLSTWLLSLLGIKVTYLYETGIIGIIIAFLLVAVSTTITILDINFLDNVITRGSNRSLEWFSASALTISLIWFYLEIVRFLARLKHR